jgi:hypothetical protein
MRHMALLAVFAVFAGNYQRMRSRNPQKSWVSDGSANARTARRPLFRRCSPLFLSEPEPPRGAMPGTAPGQRRAGVPVVLRGQPSRAWPKPGFSWATFITPAGGVRGFCAGPRLVPEGSGARKHRGRSKAPHLARDPIGMSDAEDTGPRKQACPGSASLRAKTAQDGPLAAPHPHRGGIFDQQWHEIASRAFPV